MKKSIPLILIFIALIAMWAIYGGVMNTDEDARALSGEYKVEIDDYALVIRNETPLTVTGKGYFQNVVESETKIWAGETVGWFCHGTPDKEVVKQLNLVNQKIREASVAASDDKALTNDVASIDNKILSLTKSVSALASAGKQKELNAVRSEIDLLIERKNNILNNGGGNKAGVLETLNAQKAELEGRLGNLKQDIVSDTSGVFVASADGLENVLSLKSVQTLTPTAVTNYLSMTEYKANEDVYPYPVCKVTDNTQWILAVVCDDNKAMQMSEGKKIKVSFPEEGNKTAICTVYKKSQPENGKTVVYIMGTTEIYNIFTARKIKINILIDSYNGLRIPVSSVRSMDGKDYVFVEVEDKDIKTEVTVLYRDEEYAIVKEGENLKFYDKVKTE